MMRGVNAYRRDTPPNPVLAAFGLAPEPLRPAESGLINSTWHVVSSSGAPRVLQRVNPVFPPAINEDIDALTRHLAEQGLATPRVVPTLDGHLWLEHAGATWRVLTAVEGVTRDALQSPAQAREAGRVLGAFHRAVADFDYEFKNARLGVHDTQAHLAALRRALVDYADHPHMESIAPLAEGIFARARDLPTLPAVPDRLVHGDPKVSNIIFDATTNEAVCLIDLDTLTRMPVALELGDAMRSWCNPKSEDAPTAHFSLPLYRAAMEGYAYAAGNLLSDAEWRAVPAATLTITIELAARFCADALAERYFLWDRSRYSTASAHNQARTVGQLELAASIEAQRRDMETFLPSATK